MDGYKVRAKLALNFTRPMSNAEAEDVMMQYARAFAGAVECELSNGDLPFEEHELLQRITDQVQALPKKNVKLIGLHVWHKGAISSGSMLAVKPGQQGKPTVPAMQAVSQTRERAPESSTNAHIATTVKPPEAMPSSGRAPIPTGPDHIGSRCVDAGATLCRGARHHGSGAEHRPNRAHQHRDPVAAAGCPAADRRNPHGQRGDACQ